MSLEQIPEDSRLTTFPIARRDIWNMYEKAEKSFWSPGNIDLSKDITHYDFKLSPGERDFLNMVLAFFAASDGIVNENLCHRFRKEINILEVKYFYDFQIMMENIHAKTYSLLIETYVRDEQIKNHLFNAIQEIPTIKKKAEWAFKWIESDLPLPQRIAAFACVEGIFFTGSFAAIFWIQSRGLMLGLSQANEYISRDEALHCSFACLLLSKIKPQVDVEILREIITSSVEIESEFIREALPWKLKEMNSDLMIQHIQSAADTLAESFGINKIYNVISPFAFAKLQSLEVKNQMHETRGTSYARSAEKEEPIRFSDDF